MCIYMFIFTELIEETGRLRIDFWHGGIFLAWLGQVRVLEKDSPI